MITSKVRSYFFQKSNYNYKELLFKSNFPNTADEAEARCLSRRIGYNPRNVYLFILVVTLKSTHESLGGETDTS